MADIFGSFQKSFAVNKTTFMSVKDYLDLAKNDSMAYSSAAERMVRAIGEPTKLDTSQDPRLSRIYYNRTILTYPSFADFYGMEDTVERIVGFFRHAMQGLEERKQILYLLGPVGAAKSSISERLKQLMEVNPIYVLTDQNGEISPVFESPLGLFPANKWGKVMRDDYNVHERYLSQILSPWAAKRLREVNGDLSKFQVARIYPSQLNQIAISKTEPGDENNQDISTLVGKVDIRKLEKFAQHDPDAYAYSGGLCLSNQGLLEFVEMFKAPIKVLHPLLTATQEGNYSGTEKIGAIPFNGIVLAHSNESEWQTFRANKNNEAFIDRICVIKVPYCLRVTEEQEIYRKMLSVSELAEKPCTSGTLQMLARFSVLTRLKNHENSTPFAKMRVYDGENLKDTDTKAKPIEEYRQAAGVDEGMDGFSTRSAFKVLSQTFNHDPEEIAADPVHLMAALEKFIKRDQMPKEKEESYLNFLKEYLVPDFVTTLSEEIQKAYIESYSEFGQSRFDRYLEYADHWLRDIEFKDPDTGQNFNREILNRELEKMEKPAEISNPKDFRNDVVGFWLRYERGGKKLRWTDYEKLKVVIEKQMFSSMEEMLPIISFGKKANAENETKHKEFVSRMMERGYTERQVRRLVDWHTRMRKS